MKTTASISEYEAAFAQVAQESEGMFTSCADFAANSATLGITTTAEICGTSINGGPLLSSVCQKTCDCSIYIQIPHRWLPKYH
jgi:hypothetical protein